MEKHEAKMLKMKSKTVEYQYLRSAPKLEGIVESCSKFILSRTEFPFENEPKTIPNHRLKFQNKIQDIGFGSNEEEDEDLPYLIVFVLGGIAHNEIAAIEALSRERRVNHHLIIGGTSILTAEEYLKQLQDLSPPSDPSSSNFDGGKSVDISDIELGLIRK